MRWAMRLLSPQAGSGFRSRTLPSAMTSPPSQHHCTRPPSNCSLYSSAWPRPGSGSAGRAAAPPAAGQAGRTRSDTASVSVRRRESHFVHKESTLDVIQQDGYHCLNKRQQNMGGQGNEAAPSSRGLFACAAVIAALITIRLTAAPKVGWLPRCEQFSFTIVHLGT